ncbi:DUF637 domain-containing protein, partial [uncultured Tateyamaria sp.]|uniref:DUF637 domain-containing protein n=1 Tax=uncultured Tateyamaria sp. TaxID=455651 RepID=UPI002631EF38
MDAFVSHAIVGSVEGVVTGNFDIGEIVEGAAFAGLSVGISAGLNDAVLSNTAIGNVIAGLDDTSLFGFGNNNLSLQNLVKGGIANTISAGVNAAFYDTDFLDGLAASTLNTVVNLTLADAQFEIGELGFEEGSLNHALLHGLAGCVAAEAQGADCAAGAAGGVAQSIYAGQVENEPEPGTSDHQQWQMEQAATASMWGALAGHVFSGSEAANVSIASSIAQSGFINNYLSHAQWEEMVAELADCEGEEACEEAAYHKYETISFQQQDAFGQCIIAGGDCSEHIEAIAGVNENILAQTYGLSSENLQNSEFLQSLISIQSQDALTLMSVRSGIYSAADAQNFHEQ